MGHGGGEVAADGGPLGAWRSEENASARGSERWRGSARRVGLPSKKEVAGEAAQSGGWRCPAAAARGAEQAGRLEVEERTSLQFLKIPGTQL